MTAGSSYEARLAELDRHIGAHQALIAALNKEKRCHINAANSARGQLSYLRFARWLRKPARDYSLWQPGVLLVGAGFAAVVCFIVFDLFSNSSTTVYGGCLIGTIATAGFIAVLLKHPNDAALPMAIVDADVKLREFNVRANTALRSLTAAKQQLAALSTERTKLLQSVEWQRAKLLQREWRAMRDSEWEDYLLEVFRALGATAQRTGKTGDQGVDLVVQMGGRCIAVQAKGYYHAVNNKAVQEAVAGKAHYRCCSAAVVTNSRFTKGAIELAQSNNCALVGEAEFPDFVMGKFLI